MRELEIVVYLVPRPQPETKLSYCAELLNAADAFVINDARVLEMLLQHQNRWPDPKGRELRKRTGDER